MPHSGRLPYAICSYDRFWLKPELLYRWPSQITHATFLGLNWGWMNYNTPRFESDVSNINSRATMVAEYLIAFIETIRIRIAVNVAPDAKGLRKQLRGARTRLKIPARPLSSKNRRRPRRAA